MPFLQYALPSPHQSVPKDANLPTALHPWIYPNARCGDKSYCLSPGCSGHTVTQQVAGGRVPSAQVPLRPLLPRVHRQPRLHLSGLAHSFPRTLPGDVIIQSVLWLHPGATSMLALPFLPRSPLSLSALRPPGSSPAPHSPGSQPPTSSRANLLPSLQVSSLSPVYAEPRPLLLPHTVNSCPRSEWGLRSSNRQPSDKNPERTHFKSQCKSFDVQRSQYSPLPHGGTCSKTPSRCLKPQTGTHPLCTLIFDIRIYL